MDRRTRIGFFAVIALSMIAVDRMSKSWAAGTLVAGVVSYDFHLFSLTLVHNTGAAFGMGAGKGIFFVLIALVIAGAIIGWLVKAKEQTTLEIVSLALVLAGGLGNMIDRLTTGYVTDFIQLGFIDFPVFNVADMCVTCGVILFIASTFSKLHADQREIYRALEEESAAKREREKQLAQAEQERRERIAAIEAGYEDPDWGDDEDWERAERERLAADAQALTSGVQVAGGDAPAPAGNSPSGHAL